ncbi:hypothetical protein NDU88_003451 [Pleurodeles waltl]|uniref:Uncharacterized protein n=1 Tax=Pleurodeles waltl TaxID=8319 RepID=A0AAV7W5L7_PLEWA|nr:hypothetical protein NDU88_003451 [Pleurodeles waltl]
MACCGGHRCGFPGNCFILVLPVKCIFRLRVREADLWIKPCSGVLLDSNKPERAPKNAQTSGEKAEKEDNIIANGRSKIGARQKHAAKDLSSSGPAGRRSVTGLGKLSSKTSGGIAEDVAGIGSVAQTMVQTDSWLRLALYSTTITNFFTSGGQENGSAGPLTQFESMKTDVTENSDSIKLVMEPQQTGAS